MTTTRTHGTLVLALLAGLAPLACAPGGYDAANLPQSAGIVVAGWSWVTLVLARAETVRWPRPPWPLIAALAWAGLSLTWAGGREPGLALWLHWLACALVFVAARALWHTPREAGPVFGAVTAAGGMVALIGLAQAYLGLTFFPQGAPPAATFVNKNVAAGFVVLSWPFALVFLRGSRGPWPWLARLALGLQLVFCWRTFARSAWLALGVQLLLVLAWTWPRAARRTRLALGAALVATALMAVPAARRSGPAGDALRHLVALRHAFDVQPTDDMRIISGRGRLAVWANTLAMIRERPLAGLGLGAHARAYPLYAYASRPDPFFSARYQLDFVHNDFLQTAAEQGLVGLGLLVALLGAAVRGLLAAWRRADDAARPFVRATALVLAGVCVDACFSFPLERALPPFLLALAAAAATARSATSAAERRAPRALALVALGLAALQAFYWARTLAADREIARMFVAWNRGDLAGTRRAGERAASIDPAAFEPAFILGRLSLDEGRAADALRWLELALARRPNDAATLGTRAEAWALAGEATRAAEDARRTATLLPRDARAQYEAGQRLERVGRVEDARLAFERACALDPGRADFHLRLAVSAWRSGRRAQALEAGETALRLDPRLALAHKLLGLALLEEPGRRAEALEHVRLALALDAHIPDAERLQRLLNASR